MYFSSSSLSFLAEFSSRHCLDFLTLSTGEAYPQTPHAISFSLRMDKHTVDREALQIIDDIVACRFLREDEDGKTIEQRIITVNWRDGEILNVRSLRILPEHRLSI